MLSSNFLKTFGVFLFIVFGSSSWANVCTSTEKTDNSCFGISMDLDINLNELTFGHQMVVTTLSCSVWPPFFQKQFGNISVSESGALKLYDSNEELIGELVPGVISRSKYSGHIYDFEFADCEI